MTTGVLFSRLCVAHGYDIFDYVEYPSLIRGGHNVYEVRVAKHPVYSQEYGIDVLFALNEETARLHKDKMKSGSIIIYDADKFTLDPTQFPSITLHHVPLFRLIQEIKVTKLMENNVAIGASAAVLGMDKEILMSTIANVFSGKDAKVIAQNQQAAAKGFDYIVANKPQGFDQSLPVLKEKKTEKKLVLAGNEAVGLGALAAGCKFYVAYPMSPSSSALHFMAAHSRSHTMVVKHAEDEISVINMAIGAGYAGVRSMLGTAGGGFALMAEGLGLAGMTETPLVIFVAQRPGPATGMPTWTQQGDMQFILHAAQDEFPRIILAPGDVEEAFYLTAHAFNLADYYQTPVFVVSDKYLAESHQSVSTFDMSKITINRGKLLSAKEGDDAKDYLRYKVTDDGIPWRARPGMRGAVFLANSYEHDEYGWASEDADSRIAQVERRNRKMDTYRKTLPNPAMYGDTDADLTVVAWGSTKGPVLQALQELKADGFKKTVNFLHINHVWPFPSQFVKQTLQKAKKTLLVEGNFYGQMGQLIRQETGIELTNRLLRYDGRPLYPEDISKKIKESLG